MRVRRYAAALVVAAASLLAAAPAHAATPAIDPPIVGDCKSPPAMDDPSAGITAMLDPGPANPRTGNPFGKNANTSMYDQYRWAGLTWVDYDPGCIEKKIDMGAGFFTIVANFQMTTLTAAMAATVGLMRFVYQPTALTGALDDTVGKVLTHALGGVLFPALIGVSVLCLGVTVLWNARRRRVSEAAADAGWAGIVVIAAIASIAWAFTLGPAVDKGFSQLIGMAGDAAASVNSPHPTTAADALGNALERIAFETWKGGTFGRTDSPAVDKYTKDLYYGGSLNIVESKWIQDHPGSETGTAAHADKKAAVFRKAADGLQKDDPVAYQYLAGKHNGQRMLYASAAWLAYWAVTAFIVASGWLIALALISFHILIFILPGLALLGLHPRGRRMFLAALERTGGTLLYAAKFAVLSILWIVAVSALLSPQSGVNIFVAVLIMYVGEYAIWRYLRPMQQLRHPLRGGKAAGRALAEARARTGGHLSPEQIADLLRPDQHGDATVTVEVIDTGAPRQHPVALALAGAAAGVAAHELVDRAEAVPTARADASRVTPTTRTSTEHGFVTDTTGATQLHDPANPMPPATAPRTADGSIPMPAAPRTTVTANGEGTARGPDAVKGSPERAALPPGEGPAKNAARDRQVWVPTKDDAPEDLSGRTSYVIWTPKEGDPE